jgi:sugar phosphate isomerase/epimerase
MAADFRLGIQSYTFRAFKQLEQLTDAVGRAGLSYVEIWPGHLSYELSEEEQEAALSHIKDAGLTIDGYGAVDFNEDEQQSRRILSFAKRAGLRTLTLVGTAPDVFASLTKLCDEYDINVALHNHGKRIRWGTSETLNEAFAVASPRIGLCLDTAWCIDAGENPVEWLELFGNRLYGVHLKDFAYDNGGRRDVIVGRGGLDLPAFMRRLEQLGFDGYMSVEYEGDVDDPLPSAIECVNEIKSVIEAL